MSKKMQLISRVVLSSDVLMIFVSRSDCVKVEVFLIESKPSKLHFHVKSVSSKAGVYGMLIHFVNRLELARNCSFQPNMALLGRIPEQGDKLRSDPSSSGAVSGLGREG